MWKRIGSSKKINLSIQLPEDNSSILPIHTDVWSGNSPFELVLWIPLVSVKKQNRCLFYRQKTISIILKILKDSNQVTKFLITQKKKLNWLKINYGQGLIFSQNLLHGNVTNKEKTTRWSFNCRFKSLFSPYDKKKYGEYFTSINTRASSILGINYEDPKSKKSWYMGYIFSREIDGNIIPQKVQNLVIRDYATRTSKNLLLSSTEYKMNNSYLMLNSLIKNQNKKFNGIILYSLFMLKNYPKLDTFLNKLNKNKIKVFCALEEIELHNKYALQNLKKNIFYK